MHAELSNNSNEQCQQTNLSDTVVYTVCCEGVVTIPACNTIVQEVLHNPKQS